MSQHRDEMLALRKKIMMGDPPYEVEKAGPLAGKKIRKTGSPGLQELREIGNYGAGAGGTVIALEAILQVVEHLLERLK